MDTASEERLDRYGESVETGEVSFFGGPHDPARMDVLRGAIEQVRGYWEKQQEVPSYVKFFIETVEVKHSSKYEAGFLLDVIHKSLNMNKKWADEDNLLHDGEAEYPLMNLYTSKDGYDGIFYELNTQLRSNTSSDSSDHFLPHAWIIELMNMELFKWSFLGGEVFHEGVVFRGTIFAPSFRRQYEPFLDLNSNQNRNIAIPLGLSSSSRKIEVAHTFIEGNARSAREKDSLSEEKHFAVVWNIHVRQLSLSRLKRYKDSHSSSVVSRICATDISRNSDYINEYEILLRGAFLEVIEFKKKSEKIGGLETYSLHAVMVDANRDHISTLGLAEKSKARTLFSNLVNAEKYHACAELATMLGHTDLAKSYTAKAKQKEDE